MNTTVSFFRYAAVLLVLAVMGCGGEDDGPASQKARSEAQELPPPADGIENVLLISIDTVRADHLQVHGYERETSPFLQSLEPRAVVCDQAISQAPWTLPSHAVMFSSDYPTALGLGNWKNQRPIPSDTVLLAEVLVAAGMKTVGVTDAGFVSQTFGFGRGFEIYSQSDERTFDQTVGSFLEWTEALEEGERFFAFLHTYDVHDYEPPGAVRKKFAGDYEGPLRGKEVAKIVQSYGLRHIVAQFSDEDATYVRDLYDAGIFAADRQLRRLFRDLQTLGVLDRTLVVITSDHGEEIFERGCTGHGYTLFDENLWVPLMFVHPSLEARRVPDQVRLLDLAPTILDFLGLRPPEGWRGTSLRPLLEGGSDGSRIAFSEHNHGMPIYSVRDARWKVIHVEETEQTDLYDLGTDPEEKTSVGGQGRPEEARLRRELAAWREQNERMKARRGGEEIELDPALVDQLRRLGYMGEDEGSGTEEVGDGSEDG